jgi:hypothetical protein
VSALGRIQNTGQTNKQKSKAGKDMKSKHQKTKKNKTTSQSNKPPNNKKGSFDSTKTQSNNNNNNNKKNSATRAKVPTNISIFVALPLRTST